MFLVSYESRITFECFSSISVSQRKSLHFCPPNRYLEVLQKQRIEFEDLLSRKLREQEDALTRKANAVIQAKDQSIQSVIPTVAGYLPVIMLARVGEQTGQAAYALLNFMLWLARRSRFGVS